ncbi:hypothetical protein [Paraburkholderia sp. BCC1876]|uniref:hypothetical protein n=1 Tax=Paraburkholderia sp. BCC1876 TaxID=2676303 RepID=UPI0015907A70|nr:hypothetical protein [Paraburkholderia sp. BCC1876]
MKISFFIEPGKTLPAALRPYGSMRHRHAVVGMTLLQNPDGSFEIVAASRNAIDDEQVTRMKESIAGIDAAAEREAAKAAQKEGEKAAKRAAALAQKLGIQKAKVDAKQARIDAKKALKKAQQ